MKQVLQNLRTGGVELADVPCASPASHHLLVRSRASLLSAGTERMLLEFGKANLLDKARQQPDKVRMVLDKVRTDGLLPTLESVRAKLDQPLPLGYCNVGVVVEAGAGCAGFAPGVRVASNGYHAEMVHVPANLSAIVPDAVSDEAAAFTVLGAIALQGIRLAQPSIGETFVVSGLGLIGLVAVQLLVAQGCRVLGVDMNPQRLDLARRFGAATADLGGGEDPVAAAEHCSGGRGVDGVLIAASTRSSEPVHQAALMCRKRGRIVLTGVTGLELSRDDFYKKELSFQVSCSYGPGRYDPDYEQRGQDYPPAYVRWTAQRNFEAILELLASGKLDVAPLITHRFAFEQAQAAYEVIGGGEPSLGIVLRYSEEAPAEKLGATAVRLTPAQRAAEPVTAFIGAGNYATSVLIPAFAAAGAQLHTVASAGGLSAAQAARKFGFQAATTDVESVLNDPTVSVVVIATRHDSHARLARSGLQAGKHVFVEKPLAIRAEDLDPVGEAARGSGRLLMVGFNRRFAPHIVKLKALIEAVRQPKAFVLNVNAGVVPGEHWAHDPQAGGGRIVGEGCHFVDLLRYLAGAPARLAHAASLSADSATITLEFQDGSVGTIHYFANGHRSYPKERLEVFCAGRVVVLDNFRRMKGYGWPGFRAMNLWRQDKGQQAMASAFIAAVRGGHPSPLPLDELLETSRLIIEIAAQCRA